jgi:DNA-binding protein Fis
MVAVFEKNYLTRLMWEHSGNVSRAALAAGKERRDLGKLLKKYNIDPKLYYTPRAKPTSG